MTRLRPGRASMVFHTYACRVCGVGFESSDGWRPPNAWRFLYWPRCPRCRRPAELSAWSFLFAGVLLHGFISLLLYVGSERDGLLVATPLYGMAVVRLIRHG